MQPRVCEGVDAVFFTYYPMSSDMIVRDPACAGPDLDAMIQAAAGRPVALQEIGCGADPLLGSSDAKQATFVRAFFRELSRRSSKVLLACYFLQTNLSPKPAEQCVAYYGVDQPKLRAFLGSLGLHRSEGAARPGPAAFEEAVKAFPPTTLGKTR